MSRVNKTAVPDDLKLYFEQIRQKYQPETIELQRRIDAAIAHYEATQLVQSFSGKPPMLIQQLEELVLVGWRFDINVAGSIQTSPLHIAVTLRKPPEVIKKERELIREHETQRYMDSLAETIEREIDELTEQATADAVLKAQKKAAAEHAAMREKVRAFLIDAV